jgi:hypothetical protein
VPTDTAEWCAHDGGTLVWERQRDEPMGGGQSRRRLGAGPLEAKLIRGFGPYLYYRFREGGRHRSVYVGKVAPADT